MKRITYKRKDGTSVTYDRKDESRTRGSGSLFRRGRIWWYSFVRDNELVRESAMTTVKSQAQKTLERRIREIEGGFTTAPVTVADLMADVFADYVSENQRSLDDAKARWARHLEPVFGDMTAKRVTTEALEGYKAARLAEGAARATVNRELALLRRAFNLGREATPQKVQVIPKFPMLKEDNTRRGFLADDKFAVLAAACAKRGLWLRTMLEVGYQFGWRDGEVKSLRVRHVDLAARTISLDPHTTKNDEGRVAVMPTQLFLLVQQCCVGKKADDPLFTFADGKPVRDFRGSWEAVTAEAGVAGLLYHDLRRSAARNMDRRGISRNVIMKIMGHKTQSMFDRYRIGDHADLLEAARKMESQLTIDPQSESPQEVMTDKVV